MMALAGRCDRLAGARSGPCTGAGVFRACKVAPRPHRLTSHIAHADGGLFGKLFGGGGAKQETSAPAPKSSEEAGKVASQEVFMMANASEDPEFPPFQTILKTKDYDLRLYGVYPVVEMQYEQRQEGYAALGSFIDGDNSEGARFAYTQPVVMRYAPDGSKTMQMHLGSRRGAAKSDAPVSLASLPTPKDAAVRVSIAGGELVAVARFEGYITPTTAGETREKLLAALKRDGVKLADEGAAGGFRVGQYGAVYQLAGRINELYVKVSA